MLTHSNSQQVIGQSDNRRNLATFAAFSNQDFTTAIGEGAMRVSHGPSGSTTNSLPARFPVGAKYVVEGHGGENGQLRIISRYIVLPGGRHIKLPTDSGQLGGTGEPVPRRSRNRSASGRNRTWAKKNFDLAGTTKQRRN